MAEVDQPYSYQAQATGASTITWTLTTGPTGMTIDTNTGLLNWTPSAAGNFPVQLQADNIAGTDTQAFAIDVTALAPSVESFSAGPNPIAAGETSTLTWTTSNATDVSIDNGVGAVAADGTAQVSPATTTTYTLTATGSGGTTTSAVTVTVNLAPSVDSFSAAPTSIASGEASTLTWTTTNATDVSIDNGVGAVAAEGTAQVNPTATTTYTLTATGTGGSTTSTVTVTVNLAPSVDSFSAGPNPILSGESSTLSWTTSNTTNVSIDNGVGVVAADGSVQVSPTTTLTWTTSDATEVSIDTGVGAVAVDGSVQVSPTVTTTYTLTANGPGGSSTSTVTVTVNPTSSEIITVTKAEFRADKGEWRVQGNSSIAGTGGSVTIYIGPSITGSILGTAAVNSGGPWSFRDKNSTLIPDSTQTISVRSSQGGILEGVNLTIRN